jgi:hypothetical protein
MAAKIRKKAKTDDKPERNYRFGSSGDASQQNTSFSYAKTSSSEDSAQAFLDKKMANNKFANSETTGPNTGSRFDKSEYTSDQLKRLNANGGPTVANAGGDGKDASSKYQTVIEEGTLGGAGDIVERYQEAYGSNVHSDLNTHDQNTANEVYSKIRALEPDEYWANQDLGSLMKKAGHKNHAVNIGNYVEDGGLNVDASITGGINFASVQSQLDENDWNGEKLNSIGQLGSALIAAGGSGGKDDEEFKELIEHSPEIDQAKERVRSYENDALSGKTSADIYGGKYALDTAKGSEGINFNKSKSQHSSRIAASSFLDHKKTQLMK